VKKEWKSAAARGSPGSTEGRAAGGPAAGGPRGAHPGGGRSSAGARRRGGPSPCPASTSRAPPSL